MGVLELPSGVASGISNVQGWAYTTTEGAELVQPFAVLIDGVEQFKVPCCGDRGDVQATNPGAPLLTGFSGVYNWGLAWVGLNPVLASADRPQGILIPPPSTEILVQVVVTDTAGGSKVLSKTVDLAHPTPWPRNLQVQWTTGSEAKSLEAPQGVADFSTCFLTNDGDYTIDAATLACTDVRFLGPGELGQTCPIVRFEWDRGSQSFRLVSDCVGLLGP